MEILWKYLEKLEILSCKLKTDYQALLEAEQRRLREVNKIYCFIFISTFITFIEYQRSALVNTAGAKSETNENLSDSKIFVAKTFQIKGIKCINFQIHDK